MFNQQVCAGAVYALRHVVDRLVAYVKENNGITKDTWIGADEAMRRLRISSRTTLAELRLSEVIKYSQPRKKIILYERQSILAYLSKNAKHTF